MFGGDKALWGVESLFNVGSFFVVWRKAGEMRKMRKERGRLEHNVRGGIYNLNSEIHSQKYLYIRKCPQNRVLYIQRNTHKSLFGAVLLVFLFFLIILNIGCAIVE